MLVLGSCFVGFGRVAIIQEDMEKTAVHDNPSRIGVVLRSEVDVPTFLNEIIG